MTGTHPDELRRRAALTLRDRHLRSDGTEKRGMAFAAAVSLALKWSRFDLTRPGRSGRRRVRSSLPMMAYECPECFAWHVGSRSWKVMAFDELGEQAAMGLFLENTGRGKDRVHRIHSRAMVAQRRAEEVAV